MPRVSFVVPVRNDAVRLERCLRSIRAAAPAAHDLEILVLDNGSTDRSPDVARGLGATVFVIENAPVSELRNRGARAASGDVLAFVDADNEISGGWVDAAIESLNIRGVGATGALYVPPADGTWVQHGYGILRGKTRGRQDVAWLGSGNLAVWRHAFDSVGGFDTSLEACEDVDLCNRLRRAGFRIVGDARLESIHHGDPRTLADVFKSERWRGRDNLRVSFRRPVAWRSIPSALIPVADLLLFVIAAFNILTWLGGSRYGLALGVLSIVVAALGALLKAVRAASREARWTPAAIAHAFAVTAVYDAARACALFTRAQHRNNGANAATAQTS